MTFPFPRLWTPACAKLLKAFNRDGVEYLLIGSMAKAFHCPKLARVNDMDLMIDSTPENARKALIALQSVRGAGNLENPALKTQQLAKEGVQMHVLTGQGDVDVLTPPPQATGFTFREAAGRSSRELIPRFWIPVQVASLRDLETLDTLREASDKRYVKIQPAEGGSTNPCGSTPETLS